MTQLLGIYRNDIIDRYLEIHVFAALFTITRRWIQSKCLPTDKLIAKMW